MHSKTLIVNNLPCKITHSDQFNPTDSTRKIYLFLHGRGDSGSTWKKIIDHLDPTTQRIAVDFPWMWGSTRPKESRDIQAYATWTSVLIKKLGISRIDLYIWHSFWCRVLIKWLSQEILTKAKTVFIWAWGIQEQVEMWYYPIIRSGKRLLTTLGATNLLTRAQKKVRSDDYQQAWEMEDIFLKTIWEDLTNSLEKVSVPVLLVRGKNDASTPLRHGMLMEKLIPDSTLHVFSQWTHFVHHEHPEEIYSLIEQFETQ